MDNNSTLFTQTINVMLDEGHSVLQQASLKEKNLVLFLGASGVGKSTALNYLYGCKMIKVMDSDTGMYTIEAEDAKAKIGGGVFSKTLCPDIFEVPGKDYAFCDCPGFQDNRGANYTIAGAVLMREAVRSAKSVKGFVVLLDYNSIVDSRHITMAQTAQNLYEMIPDYCDSVGNFLFLITKSPEGTTATKLVKLLEMVKVELAESEEKSPANQQLARLIESMLSNSGNVMLCDPLDAKKLPETTQKLDNLTGNFVRRDIGLGLSSSCKIELSNAIVRQLREFSTLLGKFMSEAESYLVRRMATAGNLLEHSSVLNEIRSMIKATSTLSNVAGAQKFILISNSPLAERKRELSSYLSALETMMEYDGSRGSAVVDNVRVAECLAVLEALERTAQNNLAKCIWQNDYQVFNKAEFRAQIVVALKKLDNQFEKLEDLLKEIKSEELKKSLTEIYEHGDMKQFMQLMDVCFISAVSIMDIDITTRKGEIRLMTRYPYVLLSEVKARMLQYKSADTYQISVMANGTLMMDADLNKIDFSGINLIFTGKVLEIGDRVCSIDVSGQNGQSYPEAKIEYDTISLVELDGENGNPAKPSGDVLFAFGQTVRKGNKGMLKICVKGADGGKGQSGATGGKGFTGPTGTDANRNIKKNDNTFYKSNNSGIGTFSETSLSIIEGGQGGQGGDGGDGGAGGDGGVGSKAGNLYRIGGATKPDSGIDFVELTATNGAHGEGGTGGAAGGKGDGGPGGKRGVHKTNMHISGVSSFISIVKYYPDAYEDDKEYVPDKGAKLEQFLTEIYDNKTVSAHMGSERGATGEKGKSDGLAGRNGDQPTDNDALVSNTHAIEPAKFVGDCFEAYGFSQTTGRANLAMLRDIGVMDELAKNPEYLYEVMERVEKREFNAFGTQMESDFFAEASTVYEMLESVILRRNVAANDDSSLLMFSLSQKIAFYRQRAQGGLAGNRVVDLSMMAESMSRLIKEIAEVKKQEMQKKAFSDFSDNIDNKLKSASRQLDLLRNRIRVAEDEAARTIDMLVDEIRQIKEGLIEQKKKLEEKIEKLNSEMYWKIALKIITGLLDITGTVIGFQQVFSGLNQSLDGIGQNMSGNTNSLNELVGKVNLARLEMDIQGSVQESQFTPVFSASLTEDRRSAQALFQPSSITIQGEENITQEMVAAVYEYERASIAGENPDRAGTIATAQLTDDTFNRIHMEIQQKELSIIKKNYSQVHDNAKIEQLRKSQELLEKQKNAANKKKIISTVSMGVNVTSQAVKCAVDCISTYNSYQDQIERVKEVIQTTQKSIEKMDVLNDQIAQFKERTFIKELIPFTEKLPAVLKSKDTFELESMKQSIKSSLGKITGQISGMNLDNSTRLADIFTEVKDIVATQIEIADKMTLEEERRELAKFIYDTTSPSGVEWSNKQRDLIVKLKINRLQYLCQLELGAFALWSFPFGLGAIGSALDKTSLIQPTTEEQALKIAKTQNDAISQWLVESRYSWLGSDSVYSMTTLPGSLLPTKKKQLSTFATIKLEGEDGRKKMRELITGGSVELEIPLNHNFDIMKYVTIYANIPAIRKAAEKSELDEELKVRLHLYGEASYALTDNNLALTDVYRFPQDDIEILHGIRLGVNNSNKPSAIEAFPEDKGLEKFKKAGSDSGRSPYCMLRLSLICSSWSKKLSFNKMTSEQRAIFAREFPGDAKIWQNQITSDLDRIGWINSSKVITAKWCEIEPSNLLMGWGYTVDGIQLIKDLLYSCMALLKLNENEAMEIEFVGYGVYIDRTIFGEKYIVDPMYARNKSATYVAQL